jgi:putative transposase
MEAYWHGVSTRKVDDLVRALGVDSGISNSEVSRICADLDAEVSAFRDRSLAGQVFPYVFVDASYCKARSTAGWSLRRWWWRPGCGDGHREVLGFEGGRQRDGAFGPSSCVPQGPRAWRGAARHRRRPPRAAPSRPSRDGRRGRVHFLPNVLPACLRLGGDGRRRHRHHLRPTRHGHVHEQLDVIAGCWDASSPSSSGC